MDSNFQYAGAVNLIVGLMLARNRKFADSLLKGDGFELVVPRHESP
jgi:hypothetical protein